MRLCRRVMPLECYILNWYSTSAALWCVLSWYTDNVLSLLGTLWNTPWNTPNSQIVDSWKRSKSVSRTMSNSRLQGLGLVEMWRSRFRSQTRRSRLDHCVLCVRYNVQGMTLNCIHIFFVTGSFLYWWVMRPAGQRFFMHMCIYLRILIISYLETFLGTNSLSVLMCRKAINQSMNVQKPTAIYDRNITIALTGLMLEFDGLVWFPACDSLLVWNIMFRPPSVYILKHENYYEYYS